MKTAHFYFILKVKLIIKIVVADNIIAAPEGIESVRQVGKIIPNIQLRVENKILYLTNSLIEWDIFLAAAVGIRSSASTKIEPTIFIAPIVVILSRIIKRYS